MRKLFRIMRSADTMNSRFRCLRISDNANTEHE